MVKLIYSTIMSLDGYVADEQGNFDWAEPDEKVHTFINDLQRPVGRYLYGRRMYEVMVAWERLKMSHQPGFIQEYAEIWRAADKVVYSSTLGTPLSARTRIERRFQPEAVSRMKAESTRDMTVGGPHLAAHAFEGGLVDECQLFVAPIIVGGGTAALPKGLLLKLKLKGERRFENGVVYLHYQAIS